jgi:alpha-beta hydrolase superfamily lysophospholipase
MQTLKVTAKDGSVISATTVCIDDDSRKAVVIICHGFGEHSGSYTELAGVFQKAGYASITPNLRGHGEPPEGAKKWHGIIPGYQCFIDDLVSLTDAIRKTTPNIPIILYGHSMGGNIVINTLLRLPPEQASAYACAVLEAPWLELYDPLGSLETRAIKILSRVIPNFRIKRKMVHENLSSDTDRADGYTKDPLYHGYISMRMISGILDSCAYAMENAARLPISAYIAYADNERVVCNKEIREFAKKAGDIATVKEYKSNHAIHNDLSREEYFRDVIAYIDSSIKV